MRRASATGQIEPDASHLTLVEPQRLGKLRFLGTQNTDDLHRRSGVRPDLLAELHDNGRMMRCFGCDRLSSRQEVGWDTERWGTGYRTQRPVAGQPGYGYCGGRLVPSVVEFGDPLPEKELMLDARHARDCDLMLVLGSSLTVRPASSLVGLALRSGARVVLINRGGEPVPKAPLNRGVNVYRHLNLRLHAHHDNAFIADQDCNDEPQPRWSSGFTTFAPRFRAVLTCGGSEEVALVEASNS